MDEAEPYTIDGLIASLKFHDGMSHSPVYHWTISALENLREEAAIFRRLLESKQEELAREQKLREDREKAHNIERIQWRESIREEKERAECWRRQAESKY
jgi:hypothetical protein